MFIPALMSNRLTFSAEIVNQILEGTETDFPPEQPVQWEVGGVYHCGRVARCCIRERYVAAVLENISHIWFVLVEHAHTRELELVELSLLRPLEYRKD